MESKETSLPEDIPATGALPVYLRIAELVSRQIDAGILADGHRLPPEREMADAHGVSVGTLRKALARLTEMGCLERRQGRATTSGRRTVRLPSTPCSGWSARKVGVSPRQGFFL